SATAADDELYNSSLWQPGLLFGGNDTGSLFAVMDQNVDSSIHGCADEDLINMFISHQSSYPVDKPQDSIDINVSRSVSTTAPSLNSNDHGTKATKKSDHNVKEKLRRMRLNDAYSSLKSLLPDSYISKKKWSSPLVVAKVLEYIPELQEEVEKLKQKKGNILLSSQEKQIFTTDQNQIVSSGPTVSTIEITEGEITAQVCVHRERQVDVFPLLLANLEREGIHIASASTLSISAERVCYHLHLFVIFLTITSNPMNNISI
ncbi:hypothetical protein C5167_026149, partial [Papaver somniferum]